MGYYLFDGCIGFSTKMEHQTFWCKNYFSPWGFLWENFHVATKTINTTRRKTQGVFPFESSLWSKANVEGVVHQDWCFLTHYWFDSKWIWPQLIFFNGGNWYVILILYVDDLLLKEDNTNRLEILEKELTKQYEMMNMGLMNLYIKIEFIYFEKGTLSIKGIMIGSSFAYSGCKGVELQPYPWMKKPNYKLTWILKQWI